MSEQHAEKFPNTLNGEAQGWYEQGRKDANAALLKALQDAPEPPTSEGSDEEFMLYAVGCRKWYRTVRAEALKLAGVK